MGFMFSKPTIDANQPESRFRRVVSTIAANLIAKIHVIIPKIHVIAACDNTKNSCDTENLIEACDTRRGGSLTIAANLIEACDNLDPDELERMISDIAKGFTTIAAGIRTLLPKVSISTDVKTRSSALFIAACQQGLKIYSELDTTEVFINPKQCASLTECMHKVAKYLRKWQNLQHPDIWVCSSAMVDLVRCLETGLRLLRSCEKENWKRRALLGEISTELIWIHKDLDNLVKFIVLILGTPNERNNFQLASPEALFNASEDLKHLKEHLLERLKMSNDRLFGYFKSKYGIGGDQSTLIDNHEINRKTKLGAGSFAMVFEVEWMGEVLALKTFMDACLWDDERKVLSQVSHPNIVKVIGYPQSEILMELLDTDLKGRGGPSLEVVVALDIMHQVAKAMSYLHDIDIVHRDLKPSNILLNTSLDSSWSPQFVVAKLSDFGISKDSFDTMRNNTNWQGTPSFMAPELKVDADVNCYYNRKIDVFSFGVTFVNILCGHCGDFMKKGELEKQLEGLGTGYLKPLVLSCLNADANLRPSFSEICNALSFLRYQLVLYDDTEIEGRQWVDATYHKLLKFGPEEGQKLFEELTLRMTNHCKKYQPK